MPEAAGFSTHIAATYFNSKPNTKRNEQAIANQTSVTTYSDASSDCGLSARVLLFIYDKMKEVNDTRMWCSSRLLLIAGSGGGCLLTQARLPELVAVI